MDGFDNNNMKDGRIKKVLMGLIYVVVAIAIFAGGAFAYSLYFNNSTSVSQQTGGEPKNLNIESQTDAMLPAITPLPTVNSSVPPSTPSSTSKNATPSPTPNGKNMGIPTTTTATATATAAMVPTPKPTEKPKITQRQKVLDTMHKMANSKVVAEHIWGEIPILSENVEEIITEVSASSFPDKVTLLDILDRWENEDFSDAVNDHNYVWAQLGGTVGKATALRN